MREASHLLERDDLSSAAVPAARTERNHIPFLDGLRGCAAVYVCLTHIWNFPTGGDSAAMSPTIRLLRFLMEGGHCAVSVFIVLSGYCLMLPYCNGRPVDAVDFLKTRALRILPPYYACLVICLVLNQTLLSGDTRGFWSDTRPITAEDIGRHIVLIHDWFAASASKIDYVLWSVGVEWKIYFLMPALVLTGRLIGFWRTAAIAIVGSYAIWAILFKFDWLNPDAFGSSVYYVGLFTLGMATAVYVDRCRKAQASIHFSLLGGAIAIVSLAVVATEFKKMGLLQWASIFSGTLTCLAIVWIALRPRSYVRSLLSSTAMTWLGKISFSLYLIHPPILALVWTYLIGPRFAASPFVIPITFVLSFIASIGGAYLFFLAIEAPSLAFIAARKARRRLQTWHHGA